MLRRRVDVSKIYRSIGMQLSRLGGDLISITYPTNSCLCRVFRYLIKEKLRGVCAEAKSVSSLRNGVILVARSAYRCVRTYDSHPDSPPSLPFLFFPFLLSSCRRRVEIGVQSERDVRD